MSVSDNFNRADDTSLGAGWTEIIHGMQVSSTTCRGVNNGVYQYVVYSGATWADSHSSQADLPTVSECGLCVQMKAGPTGYVLLCRSDTGLSLYRVDGGSYTLLQAIGGTDPTGTTVKLELAGTTLKVYRNGVQVGTDQDAAASGGLISGGRPGLFSAGDHTTSVLDNWVGTGEAGGGGTQPPIQAFCGNTNRVIRGSI